MTASFTDLGKLWDPDNPLYGFLGAMKRPICACDVTIVKLYTHTHFPQLKIKFHNKVSPEETISPQIKHLDIKFLKIYRQLVLKQMENPNRKKRNSVNEVSSMYCFPSLNKMS